jgi:membrane protease YdiL (CAAX protease family)
MAANMQNDARAYRATLICVWALLGTAAGIYSIQQHIPPRVAIPFLIAALIEVALYLVPGFAYGRALVESIQPLAARAFAIEVSTLVPYCVYSIGTGTFHWRSLGWLALVTTAVSAWYVLRTKKQFYADLLFLVLIAAVLLTKVFDRIYIELHPRAPAEKLGQLMWIRTGILSVLTIRGMSGINFGFMPTRKDWFIGVQQFLFFTPLAVLLGLMIRFAQPHPAFTVWWKGAALAIGTFAGILWVVALSEEFFVRGMLQQLLVKRFKSTAGGLILTSLLFGAVHLPFRQFPNWRFALLATLAGIFYGLAYLRAGSIRAAMVTHALVVTTWKVFFA